MCAASRAQFDARGAGQAYLDPAGRAYGLLIRLAAGGQDQPLPGPQRLVDPGDRGSADRVRELIQPVEYRQDQPGVQ